MDIAKYFEKEITGILTPEQTAELIAGSKRVPLGQKTEDLSLLFSSADEELQKKIFEYIRYKRDCLQKLASCTAFSAKDGEYTSINDVLNAVKEGEVTVKCGEGTFGTLYVNSGSVCDAVVFPDKKIF